MQTLPDKVQKTIRSCQMVQAGETILVGVSGGPDSMTLLHILMQLRHAWGIQLHIVHVNHGLRRSAKKDQKFVHRFAQKNNIPFSTATVKIMRKSGNSSIENIAREARLKFFLKTAQKEHIKTIALGHTQDDLTETVLMRILRGTGLHGLRSILPKRKINGLWVIRPLIHATRSEIVEYLKANKVRFRTDHSNYATEFFRNKIRLKLIPLLEQYSPNVRKLLANLAANAAVDYDYLSRAGDVYVKKNMTYSSDKIKIKLSHFKKLHQSIQRIVLRQTIDALGEGGATPLSHDHIQAIETMLKNNKPDTVVTLPGNKLQVTCDRVTLCISKAK